ncbi:Pv-fam-d protein [Plasmodium vivax Mauritania I]|uniref:Pv-fam-d protein n=1 Tax=Plasmodium vivax Mauritania I TaxID=1035515 RepID=A0A0J9TA21_PLAVI|nr:Pv-fam-d protein [Plasmodium vivax Mauritania I]
MKERTNNYFYLFSKAFTYSILIWIWQRFEQSPSCGEPWNIEGKQNDSSGLRASRLLRGDAIMDFHQGYPQYRDRYMQGPVDHRGGAGGGGFAHQLSSLLKDKRIQKKINKMLKGKKQHGQMNDLRFNGNIDKLQKLLKGNEGKYPYDHEKSSASMKSEYDSEKQYPPQNYDDRFNGPYNSFDTDENYKGQYNRPKKGGYPDQQFNAPKHYGPYGPNVKDSKHQKKGHKSQHAPNVFGHPQQHLDMRKGPGNFQQEAFRGMTPDNRQKSGEALMREEYEKAKESKKELAKERTALGNLLKYIDTSFEYEMMRSMKAKNKETSPVKEKGMRSTLFFYMKKYKLLFPLLFNLIAVAILAMMGFEVGAIVLCIVGIMMVVYYEVKLNKIKRMHRAFKKFNARYHVLP